MVVVLGVPYTITLPFIFFPYQTVNSSDGRADLNSASLAFHADCIDAKLCWMNECCMLLTMCDDHISSWSNIMSKDNARLKTAFCVLYTNILSA